MTATLDLATGPVLCRAANLIVEGGLGREDFTDQQGRPDTCGAIALACGLDSTDWDDLADPAIADDERDDWQAARAAALAALRTLVGHLRPDLRPEDMSRRELVEWIGDWNDHPDRTPAQVVTAMRVAAREEADRA